MSENMKAVALGLARRGMAVFPLVPNKKEPKLKGGERLATTDAAQIEKWWTMWPACNVGVAPGKSGMMVVDLDVKPAKGKDGVFQLDLLTMEHGDLPPTLTVDTPSGGRHIYLRGEARASVDKVAKGIDIRGTTGYVVGPGSTMDGKSWSVVDDLEGVAECPEWLLRMAGRRKSGEHTDTAVVDLDLESNVEWARHFLEEDAPAAVQNAGGDNTTFRVACQLRERGISEETAFELMMEHYNGRCEPEWSEEELRTKVKNGYAYAALNAPGADTPEHDFGEPVEEIPVEGEQSKYHDLGEDWVYITGAKRFLHRKTGLRWDAEQFNSRFNARVEKGKASEAVFKKQLRMRHFNGFAYLPDEPEMPDGDKGRYNLWRGSGVTPRHDGAPWLTAHARYLLGDEREVKLLLDWLAWLVQRPRDKPNFGVILKGRQGTGKSWFGLLMRLILGAHNVATPANEDLRTGHNSWVEAKQLVVVEELMAQGRLEVANLLKPLITQPFIRVREKYLVPYDVDNHAAFLCFTNHEDAVPIEKGDRRWLVLFSEAEPRGQDYYEGLFARLASSEDVSLALGELLARDLAGFDALGRAPETSAKETMREAGMDDVQAELLAASREGLMPFDRDLATMAELRACLTERTRQRANRLDWRVGAFLRSELGSRKLPQVWLPDREGRVVLWTLRRHETWAKAFEENPARVASLYAEALAKGVAST